MRYFFLMQDVELPGAIRLRDLDITGGRCVFTRKDAEQLRESAVLYLAGDGKQARWDFLESPVLMFAERFREILDAYEPELIFQEIILIHKENSLQYRYVHTLMDELDVLGSNTEYYPNGTIKRPVLDRKKIGRHHLFLIKNGQRKDPVISLSLAESILRRNPVGIRIEEVEVE